MTDHVATHAPTVVMSDAEKRRKLQELDHLARLLDTQ
jgi:hypothetical protein